jgi:hypothetical protein
VTATLPETDENSDAASSLETPTHMSSRSAFDHRDNIIVAGRHIAQRRRRRCWRGLIDDLAIDHLALGARQRRSQAARTGRCRHRSAHRRVRRPKAKSGMLIFTVPFEVHVDFLDHTVWAKKSTSCHRARRGLIQRCGRRSGVSSPGGILRRLSSRARGPQDRRKLLGAGACDEG